MSATDSSITGGAPGIMAYGNAEAGNWSGGNAALTPRFQATYMSTDSNGIQSYQVISSDNGYGPQELRVLQPTNPAPGVPHNFLFVLPVEQGLGTTYGDGLQTLLGLNAQNQYNLTIIEPTFGTDPWYADNPSDPNVQYETYHDPGPSALGGAEPGHHGQRAELADRVLEIRHRRHRI